MKVIFVQWEKPVIIYTKYFRSCLIAVCTKCYILIWKLKFETFFTPYIIVLFCARFYGFPKEKQWHKAIIVRKDCFNDRVVRKIVFVSPKRFQTTWRLVFVKRKGAVVCYFFIFVHTTEILLFYSLITIRKIKIKFKNAFL